MKVEFFPPIKPGSTPGFRGNIDPAFNPNPMLFPKMKGTIVEEYKTAGRSMVKVEVEEGGGVIEVESDRCRRIG
jgi:hypothetical protein